MTNIVKLKCAHYAIVAVGTKLYSQETRRFANKSTRGQSSHQLANMFYGKFGENNHPKFDYR